MPVKKTNVTFWKSWVGKHLLMQTEGFIFIYVTIVIYISDACIYVKEVGCFSICQERSWILDEEKQTQTIFSLIKIYFKETNPSHVPSRAIKCSNPGLIPEHLQEWSLRAEPGISPEHCQVYSPPTPTTPPPVIIDVPGRRTYRNNQEKYWEAIGELLLLFPSLLLLRARTALCREDSQPVDDPPLLSSQSRRALPLSSSSPPEPPHSFQAFSMIKCLEFEKDRGQMWTLPASLPHSWEGQRDGDRGTFLYIPAPASRR